MMGRVKKGIVALVIVIALMVESIAPVTVSAAEEATIKANSDGTVSVKYNNKTGKKVKVLVKKGEKQYSYELSKGKNNVKVPLTQGNGTYTIMVCKQVSGTKYSIITQKNVKLKLNPSTDAFKPTHIIINFKDSNKAVKKAKSLTKNCKTKDQKIKTIWKYIAKNYSYDYQKQKSLSSLNSQYFPNVNATYKSKKGICYDISALYAAMLRSCGIVTKLQTGYCNKVSGYHAWNKVYNSDTKKWYVIDCTYDLCMYKKGKKISMKKSSKDYSTVVYEY